MSRLRNEVVRIDTNKKRWIRIYDSNWSGYGHGTPYGVSYILLDADAMRVVFLRSVDKEAEDFDLELCKACPDEYRKCVRCDTDEYFLRGEFPSYKYKILLEIPVEQEALSLVRITSKVRELLHNTHYLNHIRHLNAQRSGEMQAYVQEFENGVPILRPVENFLEYVREKVEEAESHGKVLHVTESSHISRDADGKPVIIYFYDIEIKEEPQSD